MAASSRPAIEGKRRSGASAHDLDPALEEIIRNAFLTVAQEMKLSILRAAYSAIIQEAEDFSVAIFEHGDLICQGETLPSHVASTNVRLQRIFDRFPPDSLEDGDVVITNDPYWGATHTPDVAVIKCVRIGSMVLLPLAFGHWADVGGMSPGSVSGAATECFQEGILIPPIKLYEAGRINQAVLDLILNNVRQPHLRAGDARVLVAACDLAEERLREITDRFGTDAVASAVAAIMDRSEQRARTIIEEIPDGDYEYEDYVDSDGHRPEPIRIHLRMSVRGSNLVADFDGTSPQTPGCVNATPCLSWAAVGVGLKFMLDPFWDISGGFYRPIDVRVPEGSFLNPHKPAATSGGWEAALRAEGMVVAALADVAPRCAANDGGSLHIMHMGGIHPKTKVPYVWMGYTKGGYGGTPQMDGCDGVNDRMSGFVKDFPVEREESDYPFLCMRYELRCDSGGPGLHRGGLGLRRDLEILDDERYQSLALSAIWDRCAIPPVGLAGGMAAVPGRLVIIRADGTTETVDVDLGCKTRELLPVHRGDVVSIRTSGGGGFGDPLERDPAFVAQDVGRGMVSARVALEVYGVVLDSDSLAVDLDATGDQRAELARARVHAVVRRSVEESFRGSRRLIYAGAELIDRVAPVRDSLVELVGKRMAPLRVWLEQDDSLGGLEVALDQTTERMLGVGVADSVWVRDPNWSTKLVIDSER